jgi:hypothetical protein
MNQLSKWLTLLEAKADGSLSEYYRWRKTPVGNLQAEIWRRTGASDWNAGHPNSRTGAITRTLRGMVENELLPRPFSVLDLCCGDGVILHQLARKFRHARCYGVDLLRYPTHRDAEVAGVTFHRVPLQEVVGNEPPRVVDVCVMLNTFRGWDRADLDAETEGDLPQRTLAWMKRFCRYVFLTVNREQVEWLKREGWFIWDVGKGEDDSRLICGFPCEGPEGPGGVWTLEKPKLS